MIDQVTTNQPKEAHQAELTPHTADIEAIQGVIGKMGKMNPREQMLAISGLITKIDNDTTLSSDQISALNIILNDARNYAVDGNTSMSISYLKQAITQLQGDTTN